MQEVSQSVKRFLADNRRFSLNTIISFLSSLASVLASNYNIRVPAVKSFVLLSIVEINYTLKFKKPEIGMETSTCFVQFGLSVSILM